VVIHKRPNAVLVNASPRQMMPAFERLGNQPGQARGITL
jgi:hypothetical protein